MQDFEKLGAFYLGRKYDLATQQASDELVLYDSKDLVTHAVCVGMTGSGKTGLCLSLLEEAAIDGIPAIIIDPKGDLSNLLLTFPKLRAEDFAPWINEDDARRKGLAPAEFAKQQADLWKKGLADWGQDGDRIQRMLDAAEFSVYTPGSNAGLQLSILKSFDAPDQAVLDDAETLRERISSTVSSLLGLVGIAADPIQSREHILLSTILNNAWKQGQNLDLAALIGQIQQPPVTRVGVFDLESFYPSKDRFGLAMALNNLLAAPGFEAWMEGEPLDVGAMLHTAGGKPRVSIISISHMNDAERMFFVSLALNQTLAWMRSQPGTTSLRAILYMDEIFGYFPPVANPPSKGPLLTLLKQARAFGLGIVLATQNPVDLDYKGLSNAGTWFLGRLQTERDKARVLEGLEGAATTQGARFDRGAMEQILASLGNRIFLLNNVHEDAPEVFQVRWALSYLRGPLTKSQIKTLMDSRRGATPAAEKSAAPVTSAKPAAAPAPPVASASAPPVAPAASEEEEPAAPLAATAKPTARPVLPPEIPQFFIPVRSSQPAGSKLVYQPRLLGCGKVYFQDTKAGVDSNVDASSLVSITTGAVAVDWDTAESTELADSDLEQQPADGASFTALPPEAAKAKSYEAWKKGFADLLYRNQKLEVFKSATFKEHSNPNECERDFRVRLQQVAREGRDAAVAKLRQKYAPKIAVIQERIRRAQQAVAREAEQAKTAKLQTAISFGATLLGAFMGRKAVSASTIGKATTAARGVSRSMKESDDVNRAGENVTAIQEQLANLEAEFQAESATLESKIDPLTEELDTITIKPKKTNITVRLVALAWAPHWQSGDDATPAF